VTESAQTDSDAPRYRYTAALAGRIESRWQDNWARLGTFEVPNPVGSLAPTDGTDILLEPDSKLFVQDMFPYPSGDGLHVGHPLGYIATDVYARYNRMIGRNVLHALGFDSCCSCRTCSLIHRVTDCTSGTLWVTSPLTCTPGITG